MTTQHNGHPIGTKVRINCPLSEHHGDETTVTSVATYQNVLRYGVVRIWCQDVDLPDEEGRIVAFKPEELVPIYDGNEPVSWEDCVWKPSVITA